MSTRGAIARATGVGQFAGRYHHWDSYPSGLGATLHELYNGFFACDVRAMLRTLIDEHPAGWSTINGADFSLAPGFRDFNDEKCALCGLETWRHYRQYYDGQNGKGRGPLPEGALDGIAIFGHNVVPQLRETKGPECYCHGTRSEEPNLITERDAAGCGVEYVYVIDESTAEMRVLSSYTPRGKMIGMFGMGDEKAEWATIGIVDLNAPAPDWEEMDNAEPIGVAIP